jgi:hypothetical protein
MKKTPLAVFLVLLFTVNAFSASPNEVNRFQVISQANGQFDGKIILVDTVSGNAWIFSSIQVKDNAAYCWIPIPFVEQKRWPLPGETKPYSLNPDTLADNWPTH